MAEQKKRTTELDVDFTLTEMVAEPVEDIKEIVEEAPEDIKPGLEPKKKLILIAGSALVSIVLAAVVYFAFIKEDAPPVEEKPVDVKQEDVIEEDPDAPPREEYVPPISYVIPPFMIPLAQENGGDAFLHVSVELILSNEYVIKDLDKNITTLRQNLFYVFKSKQVENFQDSDKRAVLKQEIITAANRVLQRGTIYEVNFIDFYLQ